MRPVAPIVMVLAVTAVVSAAQQQPLPRREGQQPTAQGRALIRGRVIQLDTGRPLRRVQVTARSADDRQPPRSTVTDNDGRYELATLLAGRYQLSASRGGYVTIEHGQRRPLEAGLPLVLADGQTIENVNFSLPRGSVIVGRVVDEFNEPFTGATVQIHRYRYVNGQRQLTLAATASPTDDLGQFRAFGLLPGDYYVSAGPPGDVASALSALASRGGGGIGNVLATAAAPPGYVRTYYPDTPFPTSAQPVTVALGQESPLLTLALVASRTAKVSGVVLGANGNAPANATVVVHPKGADPNNTTGIVHTAMAQKGVFSVGGLVSGEYTIEALIIEPLARPPLITHGSVDVFLGDADMTDIVVAVRPGVTVRGRIAFEGGPPKGLLPSQVQLGAVSPVPSMASVGRSVRDDWSFQLTGLKGRQTLRASARPPWFLKNITRGGVDITDTAIDFADDVDNVEVLFTQRVTEVTGSVSDRRGTPIRDYVVLVFAEDRSSRGPQTRFTQTARPDQDGRYSIRGLPPGRYLAVALDYLEQGEETDRDRLESLEGPAVRMELREGETRALDLRVSEF